MRTRTLMMVAAVALMTAGLADAEHAGAIREIKPGGATTCARGDEFSFFVYEGDPSNVVVAFIGGGACWSAETCAPGSSMFDDTVDDVRRRVETGDLQGIYDKANPVNPIANWTHVVIPYCTGDIHWGDHDVTYKQSNGSTFEIHHRGATNTQAVLDWMKSHLSTPEKVLVTGCSAGSYASVYWAPHVREMYKNARFFQFGDSGAGVLPPEFTNTSFPTWGVTKAAPTWIPELDPARIDWLHLGLPDLYSRVAHYYPESRWAQFNHADDAIQQFFYEQMGGEVVNWRPQMLSSQAMIAEDASNFRYFIAPGEDHCAITGDDFYTTSADGVRLSDWLAAYLDERPAPSAACAACTTAVGVTP